MGDENKAVAAEETAALKNEALAALKETHSQQNAHLSGFKKDLTEATEKLYKKMADDKEAQAAEISRLTGELTTAKATTAAALADAQKVFNSRVTSLTNATSVENMADNVFATVQENRHKIADNYLSLKAYAGAAADSITDYVQKGQGRSLSSIGDLLNTLAGIADVKTE